MSKQLFTNGIEASSGGLLDGDLVITTDLIAKVARGQRLTKEDLDDAKKRKSLDQAREAHFGVEEGVDETVLAQTGWSVIFPADLPQKSADAIKEALKPLLDLRKEQASEEKEHYYKEVIGPELGVKKGESKNEFLKRFGRGPGPAVPDKFPYYALIVGSPETIPFNFQTQLDVQYAVGRIYFDQLEDYYRYATSVVAAEKKKFFRAKTAAFFGVSNPDDKATNLSATELIGPLAREMQSGHKDWGVDVIDPANATKSRLAEYMGGAKTPSLLFSASHGMNFKMDDKRMLPHTGSILTQDWPGPKARVPVTDKMYFSADDIASDADVFGMIAFIFACYGGGIPRSDNFYRQVYGEPKDIAPYAFLSQLPLRLLAHPRGGALGVFAHVERAWGSSIKWDGSTSDVETFKSTVAALLNGKPAGAATEYFNQRYAEISTALTDELDFSTPETQDDVRVAGLWTSNNDARNYTFLGDPAVRLAVDGKAPDAPQRASLGEIVTKVPAAITAGAGSFQPDVEVRGEKEVKSEAKGTPESFGFPGFPSKKESDSLATTPSQVDTRGGDAFKKFVEKLGDYLSQALTDAASLEISTYVTGEMDDVKFESGKFTGAKLRALTRINIDGDTLVCVPEKDGEVDTAVWNIHVEMVRVAQENRAEFMKTIVSAATSIAGFGK